MTIDKLTIMNVLDKLALEHPGTYTPGSNTAHKRETGMDYSYDDCLIGCLIREVDPELHADLLEYEANEGDSFQLTTVSNPETDRHDFQQRMHELFGPYYDVMASAQAKQDGFTEASAVVAERWDAIVAWVGEKLDA